VTGLRAGMLLAILTVGCTPIPEDFGRTATPGGASQSAAPTPAASPGVTLGDGGKVTVVGQGGTTSDPFELPAGRVTLVLTACQSTQVMPFITLVDENGQSAGLIVDPQKTITVAGGSYQVQAQTNPDCLWQVELTPAA
jgi:hypothetical protein